MHVCSILSECYKPREKIETKQWRIREVFREKTISLGEWELRRQMREAVGVERDRRR